MFEHEPGQDVIKQREEELYRIEDRTMNLAFVVADENPHGSKFSARDGIRILKNWIYWFLQPDYSKIRFFSSKSIVLRFGNTKTAHFWPYSPYSEIQISLSPLFVTSLFALPCCLPESEDVQLHRPGRKG